MLVTSLVEIIEEGFLREGVDYTHAIPRDLGVVQMVDGDALTVLWHNTRSVCDVDCLEVKIAVEGGSSSPSGLRRPGKPKGTPKA